MLNISNDYNLSFYFEFFINYLNQFDISTLDHSDWLIFNDIFLKNIFLIFFNSEFSKIFVFFNDTVTNNEFFLLLTNFLDIKEMFSLTLTSDIEENLFLYIYLMDLCISLNTIYSFFISFLFVFFHTISLNMENSASLLVIIDMLYYSSLSYIIDYDILNLKLYFTYIEKYDLDDFIFFFYNIFFFFSN